MNQPAVHTLRRRLIRAAVMLGLVLAASVLLASAVGYQAIDWRSLWHDETLRSVFLQLRLPRVVMAGLIGSTLALVGAALQALFRNPLADPFVLGVSGGGAFGASIAITLGWGTQISGLPIVFVTAFAGAGVAVLSAYRITRRSGPFGLPSALLLAGVVINLIANAGVITIQYLTDYTRALQILRWLIGSLDVVGFDLIGRMLIFLIPSWIVLLAFSNDLQLFAVDEETAVSLGVDVRRLELCVYVFSCLGIGITVASGGMIGFVGLIVPHIVRQLFGQDIRLVLPCSALLGAAFLILMDAFARTIFGQAELPVGAVTGILGGPFFLWLLHNQHRKGET
jgi:ABC-type Fe3+-siderophore transport system permease subunit